MRRAEPSRLSARAATSAWVCEGQIWPAICTPAGNLEPQNLPPAGGFKCSADSSGNFGVGLNGQICTPAGNIESFTDGAFVSRASGQFERPRTVGSGLSGFRRRLRKQTLQGSPIWTRLDYLVGSPLTNPTRVRIVLVLQGVTALVPTFGPFNREGNNTTQTDELAIEQERSGEVWGRIPVQKGNWPTVEAYPGPLAEGDWGINFTTEIEPHQKSSPVHAKWYLELTPGVVPRYKSGEKFACIIAVVTRVPPPPKSLAKS